MMGEFLRHARMRAAQPPPVQAQVETRMAVFDFIEGRYNSHRRHSALDYPSPINYERSHPAETGFRRPTPSIETG
jgi:transposase InsO family protein